MISCLEVFTWPVCSSFSCCEQQEAETFSLKYKVFNLIKASSNLADRFKMCSPEFLDGSFDSAQLHRNMRQFNFNFVP